MRVIQISVVLTAGIFSGMYASALQRLHAAQTVLNVTMNTAREQEQMFATCDARLTRLTAILNRAKHIRDGTR